MEKYVAQQHRLKRMRALGVFQISGNHSKTRELHVQNKPGISSSSHGKTTKRQFYHIHFKMQKIDPIQPKINDVLKFLFQHYSKGLLYS